MQQQFAARIVVDDRERFSGVADALLRRPGVTIAVRRLQLGDYQVAGSLIVERKTLSDFAVSVVDGRLFTQASRLARTNRARPCFILEGTKEDHPNVVISRSAMQGAIIALTLVFGLPLLRSTCPRETADLILYAADQLQRRNSTAPRRQGYHPKGLARQQTSPPPGHSGDRPRQSQAPSRHFRLTVRGCFGEGRRPSNGRRDRRIGIQGHP